LTATLTGISGEAACRAERARRAASVVGSEAGPAAGFAAGFAGAGLRLEAALAAGLVGVGVGVGVVAAGVGVGVELSALFFAAMSPLGVSKGEAMARGVGGDVKSEREVRDVLVVLLGDAGTSGPRAAPAMTHGP
jgi:hypothetical protein